jgi:hypothetical protein
MKTLVRLALVLLIAFLTPLAVADEDRNCSILGSWMGLDAHGWSWQIQFNGPNARGGTVILNLLDYDTTLGGFFPTAVGPPVHAPIGIWQRVGRDTYDVLGAVFASDDLGNTLYVAKITARDTVVDCDLLLIQDTFIQFFGPFDDVYQDTPWHTETQDDHYLQRVVFDH